LFLVFLVFATALSFSRLGGLGLGGLGLGGLGLGGLGLGRL